MKKLSKELIGVSSIPIILTILSKNESYGYEIIQNVKEISNGTIDYGDGTIYPVLHKLEKKELIESYWKIADSGRKRKYYKVSTKGKKELLNAKENWTIMNQVISKLWTPETHLT